MEILTAVRVAPSITPLRSLANNGQFGDKMCQVDGAKCAINCQVGCAIFRPKNVDACSPHPHLGIGGCRVDGAIQEFVPCIFTPGIIVHPQKANDNKFAQSVTFLKTVEEFLSSKASLHRPQSTTIGLSPFLRDSMSACADARYKPWLTIVLSFHH